MQKMRIRKSFIPIILIVVVFSCKKSDELLLQYPEKLSLTSHQVLTFPKVYTKYGEITDKTVIENYINTGTPGYFYDNIDTVIVPSADTITYKTRDTVLIALPGVFGIRVVKQSGQYIYLYLTDTLLAYKAMDNVLNNIVNNIGVFKPYYRDGCPSGFPCSYQWVYDAFIATGSQQQLEFPLLTYKITRSINGSYNGIARKDYNNVFDNSVLNLLQDGDTLAIQTAKETYVRIN